MGQSPQCRPVWSKVRWGSWNRREEGKSHRRNSGGAGPCLALTRQASRRVMARNTGDALVLPGDTRCEAPPARPPPALAHYGCSSFKAGPAGGGGGGGGVVGGKVWVGGKGGAGFHPLPPGDAQLGCLCVWARRGGGGGGWPQAPPCCLRGSQDDPDSAGGGRGLELL